MKKKIRNRSARRERLTRKRSTGTASISTDITDFTLTIARYKDWRKASHCPKANIEDLIHP